VTHPGVSDNRHRTHAAIGSFRASRTFKANTSVTAGLEMGGDRIHSGTLGDHDTARISGFGEWRHAVSPRGQLDASLRVDRYSEFGASWSPALGAGWWLTQSVRLRSSVARAFRVPTFTERYYQDPAHLARPDLRAETAWAGDAGADLFLRDGLFASATLFGRLEAQVIDWLRPTTADRWRTYNVRAVDTLGIELSVRKMLGAGAFVQAGYTGLDVRAPAVTQLSKYVRDYAPHTITAAAAMALPGAVRFAPRIEYKHRTRAIGTADSTLFDAKVGRRFRAVEVFVEGTNLFNESYQEVAGVPMPGRAVSLSLTLSAR
jgi:outer membrane receptor protein involved in Fe transport